MFRILQPSRALEGRNELDRDCNLAEATKLFYISFIFMYFAEIPLYEWYNYLWEAGLDVGIAISGTVETFSSILANPQSYSLDGATLYPLLEWFNKCKFRMTLYF